MQLRIVACSSSLPSTTSLIIEATEDDAPDDDDDDIDVAHDDDDDVDEVEVEVVPVVGLVLLLIVAKVVSGATRIITNVTSNRGAS